MGPTDQQVSQLPGAQVPLDMSQVTTLSQALSVVDNLLIKQNNTHQGQLVTQSAKFEKDLEEANAIFTARNAAIAGVTALLTVAIGAGVNYVFSSDDEIG